MRNLVFITKAHSDCGNFCTALRICTGLSESGWNCKIIDSTRIDSEKSIIVAADAVLCLHLLRCAPLLQFLHLLKKKCIIIGIIGGTDIYEDSLVAHKFHQMQNFSRHCTYLVVFSTSLEGHVKRLLAVQTPISIIPQGVAATNIDDSSEFSFDSIKSVKQCVLFGRFFLVLGRVRAVKNCISILQPFNNWTRKSNQNVHLVFLGDIEESVYGQEFNSQLELYPKIHHINGVPHGPAIAIMQQAVALINCSLNEGQSNSILEAMQIETLVLASNVTGNSDLITHLQTGFLFHDDQSFIECLDLITDEGNQDLIKKIKHKAKQAVSDRHKISDEISAYCKLLDSA